MRQTRPDPQRVLVVADVSAEVVYGGAERMLFHHVRALLEAGMQVSVLTRQPKPDAELIVTLSNGVTEWRLPYAGDRGLSGLKQLQKGVKQWWRVHASSFDVVVAEQPFVLSALLKVGCDLPRLQVCHSMAFEEYATRHGLNWGLKHKIVSVAMRYLEKKVYRSADKMLVLSQFTKRRLMDVFEVESDDIIVAAGGVLRAHGVSDEKRKALRDQFSWQQPVIVTLRNMVPRTGVDLLVQAAAMVKVDRPDVKWCVMGKGPLLEPLKKLAADLGVDDVIEFTGFLPEDEVHERLHAADVFMLPTRSLEGFGLVTIEANANGLPVVATPVSANVEVVPSLPYNRLADGATPKALAAATIAMLDEFEGMDRSALRENLQDAVVKKYDWKYHDQVVVKAVNNLIVNELMV